MLGRAGELEGRVGRGYRGVTTRPSQRDIVLHTALLFYASRRPSFLCISLLIPSVSPFSLHIFVTLFRYTLDSRAGGRGTAPRHPVASFCIASRRHPRLPCAQASPPPCSFPSQLLPAGSTHFRFTFSLHPRLKGWRGRYAAIQPPSPIANLPCSCSWSLRSFVRPQGVNFF